jgi:hypothetical protein
LCTTYFPTLVRSILTERAVSSLMTRKLPRHSFAGLHCLHGRLWLSRGRAAHHHDRSPGAPCHRCRSRPAQRWHRSGSSPGRAPNQGSGVQAWQRPAAPQITAQPGAVRGRRRTPPRRARADPRSVQWQVQADRPRCSPSGSGRQSISQLRGRQRRRRLGTTSGGRTLLGDAK